MSGDAGPPYAIPSELMAAVFHHARQAFPAECCGWLTGPRDGHQVPAIRPGTNAQAAGDPPSTPGRAAETAYVIAGADLLELARSFDGPTPARIVYHSHPNGRA